MALANTGLPVALKEATPERLQRSLGSIRNSYQKSVSRGKLTSGEAEDRMARISGQCDYDGVRLAGFSC